MWTREIPTEPGWYWFYGVKAGSRSAPRLSPMEVRLVRSSRGGMTPMHICEGEIWFDPSDHNGVYCKAALPELPSEPTV